MKNLTTQDSVSLRKLSDWDHGDQKAIKTKYIEVGKSLVGDSFSVTSQTKDTITNLLMYFCGQPCDYDLRKGIYLYGRYGVGKTITMAIIRKLLAEMFPFSGNGYMITSIEQIIETYKTDGTLDYFSYRKEDKPIHICINEFGKKVNEKIYGTQADEIVNSLFMMRYELFQNGYLTHVTSNYKPSDIKVEPIIKDRMVEMFNFIEINGDSFRK